MLFLQGHDVSVAMKFLTTCLSFDLKNNPKSFEVEKSPKHVYPKLIKIFTACVIPRIYEQELPSYETVWSISNILFYFNYFPSVSHLDTDALLVRERVANKIDS